MKHARDEFNYVLVLKKGEKLVESLQKFADEKHIKGAWVMGLGGLAWAEIGFYNLSAREYEWTRLEEPLELTSLQGNIAWSADSSALHLHATLSDTSMHARGGHLKEAEVAGTVELFLHFWDDGKGWARKRDDETGLNLLHV